MNKIITNLIQIAYDIMESEPNFTEIDKKLTQIEKEMNKNQTKSSNYDIIIIEKEEQWKKNGNNILKIFI